MQIYQGGQVTLAGHSRPVPGQFSLVTFVGEQTRLLWPADYGLRRIAVRDPTPVYPHSLIWRGDNPHPALATLRNYLGSTRPDHRDAETWTPTWAHRVSPISPAVRCPP